MLVKHHSDTLGNRRRFTINIPVDTRTATQTSASPFRFPHTDPQQTPRVCIFIHFDKHKHKSRRPISVLLHPATAMLCCFEPTSQQHGHRSVVCMQIYNLGAKRDIRALLPPTMQSRRNIVILRVQTDRAMKLNASLLSAVVDMCV